VAICIIRACGGGGAAGCDMFGVGLRIVPTLDRPAIGAGGI
jgi:hypothetical protein